MKNCIIVDDEQPCREAVAGLLRQYCPSIAIAAQAENLSAAIVAVQEYAPDIVFLDVDLAGDSGFDLFGALPQSDFDVIFTTAHEEYALRAFRHAALDYLLKPIAAAELVQAVQRSLERHSLPGRTRIQQLQRHLQTEAQQRLAVPTANGFTFVAITDIVRCEADDNYTRIHFRNAESLLASRNIGEYQKILDKHNFVRVHKSHLVNMECVRHYIKGRGGSLILCDGSTVDVSTRKREEFLRRFIH